jgi:hypothetical protein
LQSSIGIAAGMPFFARIRGLNSNLEFLKKLSAASSHLLDQKLEKRYGVGFGGAAGGSFGDGIDPVSLYPGLSFRKKSLLRAQFEVRIRTSILKERGCPCGLAKPSPRAI